MRRKVLPKLMDTSYNNKQKPTLKAKQTMWMYSSQSFVH